MSKFPQGRSSGETSPAADLDVGAINTVLRPSSSSAWTTIPGLVPRCSCPHAPRGASSRTTSPRTISPGARAESARRTLRVAPRSPRDRRDLPRVAVPPPAGWSAGADARAPRSKRCAPPASRSSARHATPRAPLRHRRRVGHAERGTPFHRTTNRSTNRGVLKDQAFFGLAAARGLAAAVRFR